MPDQLTQVEKEAVNKFPLAAGEFCRLIEGFESYDRKQMFDKLPVYLADLCQVASQLPNVEPVTERTDFRQEEITNHAREYARLSEALRKRFGDLDTYWTVFDITEKEEPARGSLASDITEIYLDLKDSLALISNGTAMDDIYWEWRFDFREHWSRHMAEALRVILQQSDSA